MDDELLYRLLDWGAIEDIIYSESSNPHSILGVHPVYFEDKSYNLLQVYRPDAIECYMVIGDKRFELKKVDEAGFFAGIYDFDIKSYKLSIVYDGSVINNQYDSYAFPPTIDDKELEQLEQGIFYESYNKLGSHIMTIDGVRGTAFAVWAPNALRVSVVGDFNYWNGNIHQMRRLRDGVFEIFIPGICKGVFYKYEIKCPGGNVFLKADPYANSAELRPHTASIVCDLSYEWKDSSYMRNLSKRELDKEPMFIYEMNLGSFLKQNNSSKNTDDEDNDFYDYRTLAHKVSEYCLSMGYTHVELMPIMEHPFDGSWGYQVGGYYAPTKRYGEPQDFMYFVDYLHERGIGVIIDWVPAHFPRDSYALATFDGTCLYEHQDPRQGSHPHWGTLIFNYGRPEVSNFLISNALFWADKYHIDGIRFDAVASMLYLDYGKNHGEWVANKYGGNENLEAIEFLKHLNSIMKKKYKYVALIAEESTAWPKVTGELDDGGLGFDFKWNMGWMNDIIDYMKTDPIYRRDKHDELTFSMVYAYSEKYILPFSHDEVVHLKGSMINKMPGGELQKFSNLRALYGYMVGHPGKKLIFMGQDIGQKTEWMEDKEISWGLLNYDIHKGLQEYVKRLLILYKSSPALYRYDFSHKGFKWINGALADENMLIFLRQGNRRDETLLFVINFSGARYSNMEIAVPYADGKYIEILNSDEAEFGGGGDTNQGEFRPHKTKLDGYLQSIKINVAPLSTIIFSFIPDKKSNKRATKTIKEDNKSKSSLSSSSKKKVQESKKHNKNQNTNKEKPDKKTDLKTKTRKKESKKNK